LIPVTVIALTARAVCGRSRESKEDKPKTTGTDGKAYESRIDELARLPFKENRFTAETEKTLPDELCF
jgi:hypothetical protein